MHIQTYMHARFVLNVVSFMSKKRIVRKSFRMFFSAESRPQSTCHRQDACIVEACGIS